MENPNEQKQIQQPPVICDNSCFRILTPSNAVFQNNNDRIKSLIRSICSYAFFDLILVYSLFILFAFVISFTSVSFFPPDYVSKLHTFSFISPSNSSASTTINYDVVFSVKTTYYYLSVTTARAYVFYKKLRLWDSYIEPFDVINYKEKMMHLNFSSPSRMRMRGTVAGDIAFEKARNGTLLSFDFRLEAIGCVEERIRLFEISCDHFEIGFFSDSDSNSDSTILRLIAPKKCKVKVDGFSSTE